MVQSDGCPPQAHHCARRAFLKASVLTVGAATIVPRHVLGQGQTPPSEKLNIAGIGVGGMGAANLNNMASQNIVALCDVDFNYATKTFKKYPQAKTYRDFRVMLEKQTDIDAVMIATPDHTHAVIAMAAIQCGKHVYCQKPLTHNVYESRMLTLAARRAGVITQMGNQGHSSESMRLICEWIWDGALGAIREVDAWCSLTYYPWGHAYWSPIVGRRPQETPAVPDTLDWDLWIGPAPMRPYHRCYHPGSWRAWWDFGSSMIGDRGVHTLDPVYWALKLGHPISVEASSTDMNDDTYPVASILKYEFPARGDLPPVSVTWYDGLQPPRPDELAPDRIFGNREGGVLFKGDKAKLMCGVYGESPQILPESSMKATRRPPKTIPRVNTSHEMDWVNGCKTGRQPSSNFDYAGPYNEMCVLGNVAKRMNQQKLLWDGEKMEVTNLPEANAWIRPPYRDGWSLGPEVISDPLKR